MKHKSYSTRKCLVQPLRFRCRSANFSTDPRTQVYNGERISRRRKKERPRRVWDAGQELTRRRSRWQTFFKSKGNAIYQQILNKYR